MDTALENAVQISGSNRRRNNYPAFIRPAPESASGYNQRIQQGTNTYNQQAVEYNQALQAQRNSQSEIESQNLQAQRQQTQNTQALASALGLPTHRTKTMVVDGQQIQYKQPLNIPAGALNAHVLTLPLQHQADLYQKGLWNPGDEEGAKLLQGITKQREDAVNHGIADMQQKLTDGTIKVKRNDKGVIQSIVQRIRNPDATALDKMQGKDWIESPISAEQFQYLHEGINRGHILPISGGVPTLNKDGSFPNQDKPQVAADLAQPNSRLSRFNPLPALMQPSSMDGPTQSNNIFNRMFGDSTGYRVLGNHIADASENVGTFANNASSHILNAVGSLGQTITGIDTPKFATTPYGRSLPSQPTDASVQAGLQNPQSLSYLRDLRMKQMQEQLANTQADY